MALVRLTEPHVRLLSHTLAVPGRSVLATIAGTVSAEGPATPNVRL